MSILIVLENGRNRKRSVGDTFIQFEIVVEGGAKLIEVALVNMRFRKAQPNIRVLSSTGNKYTCQIDNLPYGDHTRYLVCAITDDSVIENSIAIKRCFFVEASDEITAGYGRSYTVTSPMGKVSSSVVGVMFITINTPGATSATGTTDGALVQAVLMDFNTPKAPSMVDANIIDPGPGAWLVTYPAGPTGHPMLLVCLNDLNDTASRAFTAP